MARMDRFVDQCMTCIFSACEDLACKKCPNYFEGTYCRCKCNAAPENNEISCLYYQTDRILCPLCGKMFAHGNPEYDADEGKEYYVCPNCGCCVDC